jgi:hypothetical protein
MRTQGLDPGPPQSRAKYQARQANASKAGRRSNCGPPITKPDEDQRCEQYALGLEPRRKPEEDACEGWALVEQGDRPDHDRARKQRRLAKDQHQDGMRHYNGERHGPAGRDAADRAPKGGNAKKRPRPICRPKRQKPEWSDEKQGRGRIREGSWPLGWCDRPRLSSAHRSNVIDFVRLRPCEPRRSPEGCEVRKHAPGDQKRTDEGQAYGKAKADTNPSDG